MNTYIAELDLSQEGFLERLEKLAERYAEDAQTYATIAAKTQPPEPQPVNSDELLNIQKENSERAKAYALIAANTETPKPRTLEELNLERLARLNKTRAHNYCKALQRDRDLRSHISRPVKAKPIILKGCLAKHRAARARRSVGGRVRPVSASASAPSGGSSSGTDGPPPRRTHRRYEVVSTASALSNGRAAA